DEIEHVSLHFLGVLPRRAKARPFVEASADAVVSLDRHGQALEMLAPEFRQPSVEQPGPDAVALLARQYVDAILLIRLCRSSDVLREPYEISAQLRDEEAGAARSENSTEALGRIPAVEEPALDCIGNDPSVCDRPGCPRDRLDLREIRRFGSPYHHPRLVHVYGPSVTTASARGDTVPAVGIRRIPASPSSGFSPRREAARAETASSRRAR